LILGRSGKSRDVRMIGEQFSYAAAQSPGAVTVDYAHFALAVQESFVKKFVDQIDGQVSGFADEI